MQKRIVVAGAGVAGAQVIKALQHQLRGRNDYMLIAVDAQNYSAFAPLFHEAATGTAVPTHIVHPIRNLLHEPCCYFRQGVITGLDRSAKMLKTDRGDVPYDMLVLALGARTNYFGVPGAKEFSYPIKIMDDALKLKQRIIDTAEQASALKDGQRDALLHYVIVGAGYTGVEVASQLSDWFHRDARRLYPEIKPEDVKITIVHAGERIIPMMQPRSSDVATKRLEKIGVVVKTNAMVTEVTPDGAKLKDGTFLDSKNVIWASGVMAVGDVFFDPATLQKGRIPVKATLQLPDDSNVFVVGDLAAVTEGNGPHPQTAQAAYEQAHLVARNIKHVFEQQPLEGFHYVHKGDLVPIGHGWAVAEVFGIRFHGRLAWWLRRYVYLQGLLTWFDRIRLLGDWFARLFGPRDTSRL